MRRGLLAILVLTTAAWAGARGMTPADVARLQAVTEVAVSPDGAAMAVVRQVPRTVFEEPDGPAWSELWLLDVATGTQRAFVTGAENVSKALWTPDGRAVTFLAKRGEDEQKAVWTIPRDGGEARRLVALEEDVTAYDWRPDGAMLALIATEPLAEEAAELREQGFTAEVFEEDWRPTRVWLVPVADGVAGEPRRVELDGSAFAAQWTPDGSGLLVAMAPRPLVDDRYMLQRLHLVDPATGELRGRIANPGKLEGFDISPDGRRVAMRSGVDLHDPAAGALLVAPIGGGDLVDLTAGLAGDVADVAWLDASSLLAVVDEGVETALYRFPLDGEPVRLPVGDAGTVFTQLSLPSGCAVAGLVGSTAEHPNEAYAVTLDGAAPRRLTRSNPWLDEVELAPQQVVRYRARDGVELEAILLEPLGRPEDRRAPLVMIVHGGPESHYRDGWVTSYSSPGQVLAARGFAVLYPNYRGSTGRGHAFRLLSQGDPAGAEFDDLVDAVDAMVERGVADPERIGVTGGSYGGYATAWLSTRYSDRFAAGVMFVGIANTVSKAGTTDIPEEEYLVHARRRVWDELDWALERSPISHVHDARTPLLILHGEDDPRVSSTQSRELYRALKTHGRAPVRLVLYPGEEHGNRRAAARYDYTLRLLRWFEHYLVGDGGAPPPHTPEYRGAGTGLEGSDGS